MSAIDDRRVADGDPDAVAAGSLGRREDDWLRTVRFWCRRRAMRKSDWSWRFLPYKYFHDPHAEFCAREGVTWDDFRRIRAWSDRAMRRSRETGLTFGECLREQEREMVDLVSRFAALKREGVTRDKIRRQLELSHDEVDTVAEWHRDAIAATAHRDQVHPA